MWPVDHLNHTTFITVGGVCVREKGREKEKGGEEGGVLIFISYPLLLLLYNI